MNMPEPILCTFISLLLVSYYFSVLNLYPILRDYLFEIHDETRRPCRVPKLNPFDKTILDFIETPDIITCSANGPLVDSDLDYLYINKHLLPSYGVTNNNKFQCYYQTFERETPATKQNDNGVVHIGERVQFFSKVKIFDEFVEVVCEDNETEIYHDFFSFVPIKSNKNSHKYANFKQKLNVIIFGIDSLSHMNFQRQMPRTKKYIDEKLNSILMSGYNKIDDNSLLNLIPILTGHSLAELEETCCDEKFDKCHIIWNNYSGTGYLTVFAEDNSKKGAFNFGKLGFQEQPTHYFWRTFDYYAESKILKDCCLGPRLIYRIVLEYTKKVTSRLKDEPFFGIFWSSIFTHDFLNYPLLTDDDYVEFFDGLKRDNVLNNTVVVLLSDHGIRFGDILNTYQGLLEESLPLLYFIFPPWFNEQYPTAMKNMRDNSNRLTANFDIYETLLDLLDVDKLKTKYLSNKDTSVVKRGISLFSAVPKNRSCEMAGIAAHWCTCKTKYEIYTYSTAVKTIANFIVSQINNLLVNETKCAKLELKSINTAFLSKAKSRFQTYLKVYTITLETLPGGAIFQSSVHCTEKCYEEEFYVISGRITRLNRYGNQSVCISNAQLKLFCYCIQ